MDMAASIQAVTEEIMLRTARHVHARTGMKNLCLAGGVALNCVANGRILREGPFEQLWIQPAAGDAGGALGAALFIWHQLLDKPRTPQPLRRASKARCSGPQFSDDEIRQLLDGLRARSTACLHDEDELCGHVADLIAAEKVVGWLQGRMEFGPRALGREAFSATPAAPQMQSMMNLKIKFRESFRPFAPVVLRERVERVFRDCGPARRARTCCWSRRCAPGQQRTRDRPRVAAAGWRNSRRSAIGRCRPLRTSTIPPAFRPSTAERHGRLYQLLKAFEAKTGCPVMINTSFNVRGEPIVCPPGGRLPLFHGHEHGRAGAGAIRFDQRGAAERRGTRDWRLFNAICSRLSLYEGLFDDPH